MLPLLCLLWSASEPSAHTFDVSGGVTTELRGGYAPPAITQEPEPSTLLLVTPQVDFRWRSRRYDGYLGLGYAPRMQVRWPNRLDLRRPLFLHQLYLQYGVTPSRRWNIAGMLGATVGEIDYTQLGLVLGDEQGLLPGTRVTQYAVAAFDTIVEGRLARRHTIEINPRLGLRTPYGVQGNERDPSFELPTQKFAYLGLAYAWTATTLDTLRAEVRPGVVDYDDETTYVATDARAAWLRRLGPRLGGRLEAGVFHAKRLRTAAALGSEPPEERLFPVGSASLDGRLLSKSTHFVDGRINIGVNGYFDRIRQSVDPRAQFQLELTTTIPPRWMVSLLASTYTPMTRVQRFALDGGSAPDESVYRVQVPVMYMIDHRMLFEFGGIVTLRSSHWLAPDFRTSRLEAWAYVAFRFGAGTARGGEEVNEDIRSQNTISARGVGAVRPGVRW